MRKLITIIISVIFSIFAVHAQNTVKIIVNSSNSISSISKTELSNIFLKKTTKFENNVRSLPVDQVADSPTRKTFSEDYLGKSVSAVKNYWNQQLFSGAGIPPEEKKNDESVIDFVKANDGAVGYVSINSNVTGVKVITVR